MTDETTVVPLQRSLFTADPSHPQALLSHGELTAAAARYPSGVETLVMTSSRVRLEILPFMGQILWDAVVDGVSLRMDNMFRQPLPAKEITQTYGCFAFHSGLLSAGCPAPEDTHPLHGELSCAPMDAARLEVGEEGIRLVSTYEYVMGFGHHYRAEPSVALRAGVSTFDIDLSVTNLSAYAPMPLQYMCHMNYAFVPNGRMRQNLPAGAFALRRTVPAHVTPTPRWQTLNDEILAGHIDVDSLEMATEFDPEIVYFADDLPRYGRDLEFTLGAPDGPAFITRFSAADFPVATRWILHNADQRVAAFVLPGTSRPEGRLAAQKAGTLIELEAGRSRRFHVTTGIKES
ncbi:aldose 1-epimerase family protein [Actinomyces israelii]|uniref:aldose 1-epimerase family protein n=1 Tax=Actinomyces israelii TaxID=1659 RepID=UPI002351FF87|nr:aldose 1-epimerase family protein [Actinomyces israelii]